MKDETYLILVILALVGTLIALSFRTESTKVIKVFEYNGFTWKESDGICFANNQPVDCKDKRKIVRNELR